MSRPKPVGDNNSSLTGPYRLPLARRKGRAKRVYFTPALWATWHDDRRPDEHTVSLREGIQEMRERLDERDIHNQPLSLPS
jgi:hypothetical protein